MAVASVRTQRGSFEQASKLSQALRESIHEDVAISVDGSRVKVTEAAQRLSSYAADLTELTQKQAELKEIRARIRRRSRFTQKAMVAAHELVVALYGDESPELLRFGFRPKAAPKTAPRVAAGSEQGISIVVHALSNQTA